MTPIPPSRQIQIWPVSLDSKTDEDETISSHDQNRAIQSLLVDLSPENTQIIDYVQHQLCANARSKLIQAIERWLAGNDKEREIPTRVMAIYGKPGIGKTCTLSEICTKFPDKLVGGHFFQYQAVHPEQNLAVSMLLSLAHRLCQLFPSYLDALPRPSKLESIINQGDLAEVFDTLITQPLQSSNVQSEKHMLIVLDAVDECNLSNRDQLLQLINEFDDKSPDWLYLLVTLTDDSQLVSLLNRVHTIELKGSSEVMTTILKRYFKEPMSPFIDRISLDGAQAQLQQRSDGNFMCAYFHKKHLEGLPSGTKIALRDLVLFPSGLNDVYKDSFQRLFDYLSKKISSNEGPRVYSAIVGLLSIAREPIDKLAFKQLDGSLDVDETLSQLNGLIATKEECLVGFYHKNIADWIHALEPQSPLAVNIGDARLKMADLIMGWLAVVLGEPVKSSVAKNLQIYALKHALTHLTDVPEQQDNIARILCSVNYVQEKLTVGRESLKTVLMDYKHKHHQQNGATFKLVTLKNYMKKFPDLTTQIEVLNDFLRSKEKLLEVHPEFALHVAANFPTNSRIQQNARVDISDKPWLENLTAVADTPFTIKRFEGAIFDIDATSDNKSIVLVTVDTNSKIHFYVINAASGYSMFEPIDLTSVGGRIGVFSRVMADNTNVFVGSITSYVSLKTGKLVPSGLDPKSIPIKEQFSIDCCDVTADMLGLGVTTLPFGGRSLHMLIFDLKSKKFAKNIEVLKFKFGGSPQFGIKACSFSADKSLLCTCTKQVNKNELKVATWSTSTWNALQTIDVENDALSHCSFIGNNEVVIGGSIRARDMAKDGRPIRLKTYLWSLQNKEATHIDLFNSVERCSIACVRSSHLTTAQWIRFRGQVTVNLWKKAAVSQPSNGQFICYGLDEASDLLAFDKTLVFVGNSSVRFYKLVDFENVQNPSVDNSFPVSDALVQSISFFPRSDEPIVTYRTISDAPSKDVSSCKVSLNADGTLSIAIPLFTNEKINSDTKSHERISQKCFTGPGSCLELCRTSADGSCAILNNGSEVIVAEIATGVKRSLSVPTGIPATSEKHYINVAVSPKDSIVGIVYSNASASIYLYDIKAKSSSPPVEIRVEGNLASVDDFCFMPSNGLVVAYCQSPDKSLSVFNQRTCAQIYREVNVDVAYVAISPTSDRLAVSRRCNNSGTLILRSSDSTLNTTLKMASECMWMPDVGKSDVEFSGDGTIVMGVCVSGRVGRIWNAGNGEVLIDLNIGRTTGDILEIVGMLTNTHALIYDTRSLFVCDIGTASIIAVLPLEETLARKWDGSGLRVSPRGNVVVGATADGSLRVFLTHNVTAIKRKTTLQILKSK